MIFYSPLGRHTSFTKPINTSPIQPYTIMKRAIIIGATSGIGQEVAKNLLREGWQIGIAGRRQPALEDFQRIAPEQIKIQSLDVTQADAAEKLEHPYPQTRRHGPLPPQAPASVSRTRNWIST